ncbi:hypothetical protein NQ317_010380 [Molorchus minor]|uniref:Uncharacterized protein n=1 Tax=Molorchus minor TaxID=1323400 RepID=A0ABQ9IVU8_9CUCU|nr:hypothetical protein NQ317_010380 [Molorchus minor]
MFITGDTGDITSDSDESLGTSYLEEIAGNVVNSLMPEKSQLVYETVFARYEELCTSKNTKNIINEKVLLAYFECLFKERKPSSVWSYYSMVLLIALLKRKLEGYRAKKLKILTKQDVIKFFGKSRLNIFTYKGSYDYWTKWSLQTRGTDKYA